jgi:hypothetical protein
MFVEIPRIIGSHHIIYKKKIANNKEVISSQEIRTNSLINFEEKEFNDF